MLEAKWSSAVLLVACTAIGACGSKQSPAEAPPSAEPAPDAPVTEADGEAPPDVVERPRLSADDCAAKGGTVVGDIGDGAIHRADYRCPSGTEPLGAIEHSGDGPVAVEGSVCCPG